MTERCQECGLPIRVCSALAMYRKAATEIDRERWSRVKEYIEIAREFDTADGASVGESKNEL